MFAVLLKFTGDKSKAARLMEGHNAWIQRGFDDGIFLLPRVCGVENVLEKLADFKGLR